MMWANDLHAAFSAGQAEACELCADCDRCLGGKGLCVGPTGLLNGMYVPVVVRTPDGTEHKIDRVVDRGPLGFVIEVAR